jgi:2-methylcitrate dehydratase PrpD
VGETLDAFHYSRWHNSSTAGGFGAAAAAASAYGLDAEQTSWAFGNIGRSPAACGICDTHPAR